MAEKGLRKRIMSNVSSEKFEINIAPSGLMTLENAAQYLGVKIGTVRWLRRMRKLPFVKLGAKLYVKRQDIDTYIEAITETAS